MTPAKLDIFFAFFSYSGNGGFSSCHPSLRGWFADTMLKCKSDERIGEILDKDFSDTPITMTRNAAVQMAKKAKADVLVMIDSDQYPDRELAEGDPLAKPFWDTSFDFLYKRRIEGKVTVIAAPYCGPPPHNNVYVFRWANWNNYSPDQNIRIEQYTREEAAHRAGIEDVAALPTGLSMFDMRAFDLIDHPYFYYEYKGDGELCNHCGQRKPGPQAEKNSTEDVTVTRDISLHGQEKLGYSPIFVNWDAWAGHWKPLCVDKPKPLTIDNVGAKYKRAFESGIRGNSRLVILEPGRQAEKQPTIHRLNKGLDDEMVRDLPNGAKVMP